MKGSRGFTLVEVIISIGALSVICAVLLRLFVLAGSANEMAADKQAAGMAVSSAAETLLCADTLQDGIAAMGAEPLTGEQYTLEIEGYEIHLRATPRGGDYPGALYDICVQAMRDGSVIAEISTAKYYPEENGD
jgi:prepilin-type N-terminal cleavage/methylation domain-containing protein